MSNPVIDTLPKEFRGHFEAIADGSLRFPYCESCGRFHWYPMPRCPHCQSGALVWRKLSGRGTLYSWTVVRHAFDRTLRDAIPYIVALVTFDDAPGVRLVTNLIDAAPESIRIGMPLQPVFRNPPGKRPQVVFRPA
jgi:uncharacterized OB-fold protein